MRDPMPTPVEPWMVNAKDYDNPDYLKGAVIRLEGLTVRIAGRMGTPPGTNDDGEPYPGSGLLADVAAIKRDVAAVRAEFRAELGTRPTKSPDGEEIAPGSGVLGDIAEVKKRLGRPPQYHGIDDPGAGVIAHVYDQRRSSRRSNAASLVAALIALLTSLAAVAQRYAVAAPPAPAGQSAPAR